MKLIAGLWGTTSLWPNSVGPSACRFAGRWEVVWEVRSNLTNGRIARVMFGVSAGHMVLLHGFEKKSQKTPKPDLELARKRLKETER